MKVVGAPRLALRLGTFRPALIENDAEVLGATDGPLERLTVEDSGADCGPTAGVGCTVRDALADVPTVRTMLPVDPSDTCADRDAEPDVVRLGVADRDTDAPTAAVPEVAMLSDCASATVDDNAAVLVVFGVPEATKDEIGLRTAAPVAPCAITPVLASATVAFRALDCTGPAELPVASAEVALKAAEPLNADTTAVGLIIPWTAIQVSETVVGVCAPVAVFVAAVKFLSAV